MMRYKYFENIYIILVLVFGPITIIHSNSIPRSTRSPTSSQVNTESHTYPPWNPSKKIDAEGFLTDLYPLLPGEWEEEACLPGRHSGPRNRRMLRHQYARIRQVPGDGNCLFHSVSAALSLAMNSTHVDMYNTTLLKISSAFLRSLAVDCLAKRQRRILYLQGDEYLRAKDLVDAAARQYNMTGERYCQFMRKDSYWGGGPEIVALCNVLKRPIHVYELTEDKSVYYRSSKSSSDETKVDEQEIPNPNPKGFRIRRMACFGSPKFDRREPLHILSADSRFPDLVPGRQLASGNHFLAVFPVKMERKLKKKLLKRQAEEQIDQRVRMRGGKASKHKIKTAGKDTSLKREEKTNNFLHSLINAFSEKLQGKI